MYFLAEPPLRADAHAVANDQHPDHQLGIDRRSTRLAVVGPQVFADIPQIDEAVDRAQQVTGGHVLLQAELVEQRRLVGLAITHHRLRLPLLSRIESEPQGAGNHEFFNKIGQVRTLDNGVMSACHR